MAVTQHLPSSRAQRPSEQTLGIILVLISAAGFGSGALFVQPLYDAGMGPMPVLFWRFATAALFSWGFLLLTNRGFGSLRAIPRRRVAVLLLLGALFVGNSYAYIASLQVVPITLSSIIAYLYPAIVAVLATRLVRRLEGRRAWIALGISMLGVALAVGGIPEGELPPMWGMALAFANPVIYAVWIVLQSRMAGDRPTGTRASATVESVEHHIDIPPGDAETATDVPDPSPAAAIMTTATALVYAVLVLATGDSISPFDVPDGTWLAILGLGLVATAIAIQTFYAGVKRVGGARASLISTVEPVYTIVLAMILFGERLTTIQIIGGALVIGAVILAETGRGDPQAKPRVDGTDRVEVEDRSVATHDAATRPTTAAH
jgi:drug/metabolite transporter (DMT)-like permease